MKYIFFPRSYWAERAGTGWVRGEAFSFTARPRSVCSHARYVPSKASMGTSCKAVVTAAWIAGMLSKRRPLSAVLILGWLQQRCHVVLRQKIMDEQRRVAGRIVMMQPPVSSDVFSHVDDPFPALPDPAFCRT
jgi:hypothetical protein